MRSYAGSFLVAKPVLTDPNFHEAVVLLLQHGDEGAFGLVVNRPSSIDGLTFPVYGGGPCSSEGLLMLHGHSDWADSPDEPEQEVLEGVFVGDSSCVERVQNPEPGQELRFRLFAGYAGWGPKQLEGEVSAGAWAVVPASADLLFDAPAEELWVQLLPSVIPQPSAN